MIIENGRIRMRIWDDFHVHLREGILLVLLLRHVAENFARGLVMPNLQNAVKTAGKMMWYLAQIEAELMRLKLPAFTPMMTILVNALTTAKTVFAAKQAGAVAAKIYPKGLTHNSEDGVEDYFALDEPLSAAQECGLPICLHGELPGAHVNPRDREYKFLEVLLRLAKMYPRLKFTLEHITDASSVRWVRGLENVAATITVHHLLLTEADWHGKKLKPHNFCKPEAKRFEDRDALLEAALSGDPKFFLGTDSAPHPRTSKECDEGCAGIFTAPVAIPLLVELFHQHGALDKLERFTSEAGSLWYGLPLNAGEVVVEETEWTVPDIYGPVVPFKAKEKMAWKVMSRT